MKKMTVLLLLTLLSSSLHSQTLKSLFNKYSHDKRIEYVSIGAEMISISNIFNKQNEDFSALISKVRGIKIISLTDGFDNRLQKEILAEAELTLSVGSFRPLLEVRDSEESVKIYQQTGEDKETDLLVINEDEETISLIWLRGEAEAEEFLKLLGR